MKWTGHAPNLPSLSNNFTVGSSAEGHVKFYFQLRESFHLASHLQLQLIDFIVLMVINAADCPSESHVCDCLSLHARSGGIPCFSSLIVQSAWRHLLGCDSVLHESKSIESLIDSLQFSWSSVANWIVRQTDRLKRTSKTIPTKRRQLSAWWHEYDLCFVFFAVLEVKVHDLCCRFAFAIFSDGSTLTDKIIDQNQNECSTRL